MKTVRLLPVVIFAALALLVFKGIGIVSNGGYVLTGASAAIAEDSASDTAMALSTPPEPSIADPSPTIGDTAPTLATRAESSAAAPGPGLAEQSSLSASAQEGPSAEACPDTALPPVSPSGDAAGHELNDRIGNALAKGCPSVEVPFNAYGDALPMTNDGKGKLVPLSASGDDAEPALLQRLGERRTDLDKRQADLDLRAALVAAAEQKLEARTVELRQLEAKVNELVDQKQAAEDANFKAIVSMYETMKPKEAAKIFDTLELNVLLKVARAMNPRKMSPILAAMSPRPAEALTTAFASAGSIAGAPVSENLAALPQIVGQ